jgi:hypothetical protein
VRRKIAAAVLVGAAFFAAACSRDRDEDRGDDGDSDAAGSTIPSDLASGPGISVTEALASDLDSPLLVNGYLVVTDGQARLCEALAESFPPQCGGARLKIEGLDLASIDGLQEEGGVTWSDDQIQLLGALKGGVFDVALAAT